MTPSYYRARNAFDAACDALDRLRPAGWGEPRAADWWGRITVAEDGAAKVSVKADERRGHRGEIVIRARLSAPRELVIVATAETVERDLGAAFRWAMDNLMESQNATSKA